MLGGVTLKLVAVEPIFQLYVVPPLAFSVADDPAHIVYAFADAITGGNGIIVIATAVLALVPQVELFSA